MPISSLDLNAELNQRSEDIKAESPRNVRNDRCPSSGQPVGRMIETPGSDEWKIKCPTCGKWWHGGSTVLDEHDRP